LLWCPLRYEIPLFRYTIWYSFNIRLLVQSLYTLEGPEFSIALLSDLFSYDTALFGLLKKAAYYRDTNLNIIAVEQIIRHFIKVGRWELIKVRKEVLRI
jgi:hypothetical protein